MRRRFSAATSALSQLLCAAVLGCGGHVSPPVTSKWPEIPSPNQRHNVLVVTGTRFLCDGQPCRLLGVKEFNDPVKRTEAERFARLWFSTSDYCFAWNDAPRLYDSDGTCVVWMSGGGNNRDLNTEIVRAGVAGYDESGNSSYSVTAWQNNDQDKGMHVGPFDWRAALAKARQDRLDGVGPYVMFKWPALPESMMWLASPGAKTAGGSRSD